MNNPKVLIGSPIYDKMEYCVKEFLESLKNLDYDNFDILIVDNSHTDDFFKKLRAEEGIITIKDNTTEVKNKLRLVSSRNKILNYALKYNYDYVLMMDSDVIAPPNLLKNLISHNKDIVSGLYYNHFLINGIQKLRPVAWCHITPREFEEISKQVKFPSIVKSHKDIRRHITPEEIKKGELIKVKLPSAGCMLIKRKVFEKIKYGILDLPSNIRTADDIYFMEKAEEAGFESYCDPKLKCEHLFMGKMYKDWEGNLRNPLHD